MIKKTEKTVKLDEIKVNEHNPRQIKQKKMDELKKSLKDFPEMMQLRPIVVDENGVILGGNMRYQALVASGADSADVIQVEGLTEDQKREFIIKDNIPYGDWDWDALANEWDHGELNDWGLLAKSPKTYEDGSLGRTFIMPPYSVLDTSRAAWTARRKNWNTIIGDSGEGRDDDLLGFGGMLGASVRTTSIFDPVLCELMYLWFGKKGGKVLDPFAGGSTRGLVAGCMGLQYYGNDLSERQVEADRKAAKAAAEDYGVGFSMPVYSIGDSMKIDELVPKQQYDMIMTCPPYADLEVYSDNPEDLSNMSYEEFKKNYTEIIRKSCELLAPNSFAVVVVGEVRDEKGIYRNFVGDTISALQSAGLKYYNHAILYTPGGSNGIRARRQMGNRKLVHDHQDVIVGLKGEPEGGELADADELVHEINSKQFLLQSHEDIVIFSKFDSIKELKEEYKKRGLLNL